MRKYIDNEVTYVTSKVDNSMSRCNMLRKREVRGKGNFAITNPEKKYESHGNITTLGMIITMFFFIMSVIIDGSVIMFAIGLAISTFCWRRPVSGATNMSFLDLNADTGIKCAFSRM
mmetsp:Transcript_41589/g.70197  ORF Transcript_41589/g.70197 Transcript_41589/m.70197 type:complete len:117 (-) Transcript_41589:195-545(-)